MKKLFFAIYFSVCIFGIANAKITPVSGYTHITPEVVGNKENAIKEIDAEEFTDFLEKRFKSARKVNKKEINKTTSSIRDELKQLNKSDDGENFFQNIYNKALKRINKPSDEQRDDVVVEDDLMDLIQNTTNGIDEQTKQWQNSVVPMVTAYLPPYNTPTEVPAIEHIPYLMNNIEVLPSGMVLFEETVVVVANGQKLKSGLTKILPSTMSNKKGRTQNIDYTIIDVSINGEPINYKLAKSGNKVLLVPDKNYRLPAGIYTYKFQYLADNLLLKEANDYMLYWDVGGNGWNLIIDRSFANIRTPDKQSVIHQEAIVGSPRIFYNNSVYTESDAVSYTYTSQIPLFIGTGMHILTRMDKAAFNNMTLGQQFIRSFYNYGDIYISFIGLLIIAVSFIISWRYISMGKSKIKTSLSKTSLMIRYMLHEKFDKKSICGFLLDLYKKNIIDIQQSGNTILLIKSTDNLKSLLPYEKKALKAIFPSHETTFSVTENNKLPLKRFVKILEKGLKKDVTKFYLKLNLSYLFFSIGMMFVVWTGMAFFKIDTNYVLGILSATSVFAFAGTILWYVANNKWVKIILRYLSINILAICLLIYSAVIHPLGALLVIFSIILTVYSIRMFSKRSGLVRSYIQDIIKQKEYLQSNVDTITLSKNFANYQALILVCDLEDDIKPSNEDNRYKIPVIKNIMNRI